MFEQIRMCKSSNPLCQISWGRTFSSCPCIICPALLGLRSPRQGAKKTFKTHLKRSRSFTAVHCSVPGRQAALFVCALFRCENCDCSDRALAQKTCVLCWMLGSRSGLAAETETTDDRLSFSTCGMFETEPTKLWQRYAFPCVPALFCV